MKMRFKFIEFLREGWQANWQTDRRTGMVSW